MYKSHFIPYFRVTELSELACISVIWVFQPGTGYKNPVPLEAYILEQYAQLPVPQQTNIQITNIENKRKLLHVLCFSWYKKKSPHENTLTVKKVRLFPYPCKKLQQKKRFNSKLKLNFSFG